MPPGTELLIGDSPLTFLEHPLYSQAHPGEPCEPTERCEMCAVGKRRDTGEEVLLWQAEGKHWTVSRNDPQWLKHRSELFPEGAERS